MVKAVISKRRTTVDNDTGDVRKDVAGTVEGFAEGFRRYVEKGGRVVTPDITMSVGQYPEGHPQHPAFAVQILLSPFDDREDAEAMSDRVENAIRRTFQV